jgi:hypothetical protein
MRRKRAFPTISSISCGKLLGFLLVFNFSLKIILKVNKKKVDAANFLLIFNSLFKIISKLLLHSLLNTVYWRLAVLHTQCQNFCIKNIS